MRALRFLPLLLLSSVIAGCGLFQEQRDITKDWSANKFYSEASEALNSGDYQTAIDYYNQLEARYPFGHYAMQAQLDVAYAYYKAEEPESSIAAANRFIKLHPRNSFVDYAYYLKGIVNFNRTLGFLERFLPLDAAQRDPRASMAAFNDFAELIRLFPNSPYSEDARKRMHYLRNNLAKHEVLVAQYYMRRGAYLAAANRAGQVVTEYSRTPAVEPALEIMVDAYTRLGMTDLAADAERVLTLNREQGLFDRLREAEEQNSEPLGRQLWDMLQLDES